MWTGQLGGGHETGGMRHVSSIFGTRGGERHETNGAPDGELLEAGYDGSQRWPGSAMRPGASVKVPRAGIDRVLTGASGKLIPE
jgi:hypothetical protein